LERPRSSCPAVRVNGYNHERLHTSLQMQAPHDFEQTLQRQLLIA
jgi:hypothetical protein